MRTPSPRLRIRETSNTDWKTRALCATSGYHPDLWFPESYRTAEGRAQAGFAAQICSMCPVQQLCAAEAITREGNISEERRAGVWGGTTPAQRHQLHVQRQRAQQYQAAA